MASAATMATRTIARQLAKRANTTARCLTPFSTTSQQEHPFHPRAHRRQPQHRITTPLFQSIRHHSTPAGSARPQVYEFQQIKDITANPSPERILIDVREPSEYSAGYIPTAINLPIKSQPDALYLSEEEFEDRFGFSKPSKDVEVVFYCRSGVRSSAAANFAQQQGYQKVSEYRGSWLDWEKNGGPALKP